MLADNSVIEMFTDYAMRLYEGKANEVAYELNCVEQSVAFPDTRVDGYSYDYYTTDGILICNCMTTESPIAWLVRAMSRHFEIKAICWYTLENDEDIIFRHAFNGDAISSQKMRYTRDSLSHDIAGFELGDEISELVYAYGSKQFFG